MLNYDVPPDVLSQLLSGDFNRFQAEVVARQAQGVVIRNDSLNDSGTVHVARALQTTPQVTTLVMQNCQIGYYTIPPGHPLYSVTVLPIRTGLEPDGLYRFGQELAKTNIKTLNISENRICEVIAEYLAKGLFGTKVSSLILSDDRSISNEVILTLIRNLPPTVNLLDLDGNSLDGQYVSELLKFLPETGITGLIINGKWPPGTEVMIRKILQENCQKLSGQSDLRPSFRLTVA